MSTHPLHFGPIPTKYKNEQNKELFHEYHYLLTCSLKRLIFAGFHALIYLSLTSKLPSSHVSACILEYTFFTSLPTLEEITLKLEINLEKVFPQYNVRFIAINDIYDSIVKNPSDRITVPIRNLMNEVNSRDTSIKVIRHLKTKMLNGDFIGAFAPYDYKSLNMIEIN